MIKKTLYFGNPVYLSLRNAQLVIKLPEVVKNDTLPDGFKQQSEVTKPIEDLGVVVLDNKQITITSGVLEALLENNCAIITCDSKSMPVGLMLPLYGNTTQNERFRQQLDASLPLIKQLWQQTVRMKIENQAAVLKKCAGEEVKCMTIWAADVKSGDSDNLEARAAAYYWKNLFKIKGFTRDREGIPPNNLLNYGYAILRAVVARGLVASGLLPTLGIHHHNRYNAYCLADDIMDVIATDHAPHAASEKEQGIQKAPFGIVGLETAAALTYTALVKPGILTPMQMAEKMSYNPAKILGLDKGTVEAGSPAELTIFDPECEWVIDPAEFLSKGKNTPFGGKKVTGKVMATIVDGEIVYQEK